MIQPHLRLARIAGPAILLLATIVFYWKLVLTRQYVWFDHPDMVYIEMPRLQFQAREIHHLNFPLWDPYIWCGQSLVGQTQPGPLYPLNLLFYLLPLEDGYIRYDCFNAYYAGLHFLAALFCYFLCRELGLRTAAAVFAGCVISFSGFLGIVPWLDVFNGGIWTPLIALFLIRALRCEKPVSSAALSGFFLGVAWLSGHHELPLLITAAVALTWLLIAVRRPRVLVLGSICLLVAGLVGAVQLWPTIEFGRLSKRWAGTPDPVGWTDVVPYYIHNIYSMPPRALIETIVPGNNTYSDVSPFAGAIAAALAALGMMARWGERIVRRFAVLAAASTLYAMGAFTPVQGVIYAVLPEIHKARVPMRAVHLLGFALAVLAGFGLDALLRRESTESARRITIALGGFGILLVSALTAGTLFGHAGDQRVWMTAVCACAGAAVLIAFQRNQVGARPVVATLVLLAFAEWTGFMRLPHRYEEKQLKFAQHLDRHNDIAAYLKAQPQPLRVVVNDNDIPYNFGDWHGIEQHEGYVAGVPERLTRMQMHTRRVQQLLGITHSIGHKPERPDQVDVFTGRSGIKVFQNPGAMPRAWFVHDVRGVPEFRQLDALIQNESLDFHRSAVILGEAPAVEACSGDEAVEIVRRSTGRIVMNVAARCQGMVILGDSYYPGWKAAIDGRPTPVLEVFGMLRGVVVDLGFHTVEMVYRPASVLGGAVLTLLGVVITAGLVLRRR